MPYILFSFLENDICCNATIGQPRFGSYSKSRCHTKCGCNHSFFMWQWLRPLGTFLHEGAQMYSYLICTLERVRKKMMDGTSFQHSCILKGTIGCSWSLLALYMNLLLHSLQDRKFSSSLCISLNCTNLLFFKEGVTLLFRPPVVPLKLVVWLQTLFESGTHLEMLKFLLHTVQKAS